MDSLSDTLRPLLQPITHNLPAPVNDLSVSLLGETCHATLLHDVDLTSTPCLKLAVSKALGLGIVAASSVVKVPQILKLLNSGSAAGVSLLSYLLETAAYAVTLAYNTRNGFPFSTYGETALIAGQNVVITVLVLRYGGQTGAAAVFVAALAAAAAAMLDERIVPLDALSWLQGGAGIVGVASKVPQIAAIWREGGTGQLSAFTVFNYVLGSLTRIFTTLQEVDDKLLLYGFIAGFALNAVLGAQMLYYWNAPSAKAKGKRKEEAPVPGVPGSKSYAKAAASIPADDSTASSTGAAAAPAPAPRKGPSTRRRG